MGSTRVIVPLFMFLIAAILIVCALVIAPPGNVRWTLIGAGTVDLFIGLSILVFGVPNRR